MVVGDFSPGTIDVTVLIENLLSAKKFFNFRKAPWPKGREIEDVLISSCIFLVDWNLSQKTNLNKSKNQYFSGSESQN